MKTALCILPGLYVRMKTRQPPPSRVAVLALLIAQGLSPIAGGLRRVTEPPSPGRHVSRDMKASPFHEVDWAVVDGRHRMRWLQEHAGPEDRLVVRPLPGDPLEADDGSTWQLGEIVGYEHAS